MIDFAIIEQIERADFSKLSREQQRELDYLLDLEAQGSPYTPQKPTDRQALFLSLPHKEAFYGGAAGGGKSSALLMAALEHVHVPNYAALILRRTFADLSKPGALMDRAKEWIGIKYWNEQRKQFRFPSGAVIAFGYLENETDKYQYQSAEFQYIAFDELTHFTETQYTYLFSRLRRGATSSVPLRMRCASNPGGIGAEWVAKRFIPDDWEPDDAADLKVWEKPGTESNGRIAVRAFVPARLEDNPHLDQESYDDALAELDETTREQLRRGDWRIRAQGNIYKHWTDGPTSHHVITWSQFEKVIAQRRIPSHWLGACGQDWGFDPDPCATVWNFIAAENSPSHLAGSVFVPAILTRRGQIPDDVGEDIKMIESDGGWAAQIQYRVMSHEASSQHATYKRKCGLNFTKWQPDAQGGIAQMQHYIKLRHFDQPHPFKPQLMGRPKYYVIVPDDQLVNPKEDEGLALLRAEFRQYKYVEQRVTQQQGANKIVPYDFFNHYMDAQRGIAAKWFPRSAPLTESEQLETTISAGWRRDHAPPVGDWNREGWDIARAWQLGEAKERMQKKNRNLDDPFAPASPLEGTADDPFGGE